MNNKLYEIMENTFERIDIVNDKIKKLNSIIRENITLFEDPEESDNEDVIKSLETKNIYLEEYRFLFNILNNISNILSHSNKPISIKTNYFIKNFKDTQRALDFINSRLDELSILDGTRELFTGLAYTSKVDSYTPLNLYYVKYKFPKIFSEEIELIYERRNEVMYNEQDERIINPEFEREEEYN